MPAWERFKNDFNNLSDRDIEYETKRAEDMLAEAEEWLEAVASWKEAGCPRDEA